MELSSKYSKFGMLSSKAYQQGIAKIALPIQPICQSMLVSDFQTLIKSCSIEPEMIQVQFKDLLFNKCLVAEWLRQLEF